MPGIRTGHIIFILIAGCICGAIYALWHTPQSSALLRGAAFRGSAQGKVAVVRCVAPQQFTRQWDRPRYGHSVITLNGNASDTPSSTDVIGASLFAPDARALASLNQCDNIHVLYLRYADLKDHQFSRTCTQVRRLWLSHCVVNRIALAQFLHQQRYLEAIHIDHLQLDAGELISAIARCDSLRELSLNSPDVANWDGFNAQLKRSLPEMSNLQSLTIWNDENCHVRLKDCHRISALESLHTVSLTNVAVDEVFFRQLSLCPGLTSCCLQGIPASPENLDVLTQSDSLRTIYLSRSLVTEEAIGALHETNPLLSIQLLGLTMD